MTEFKRSWYNVCIYIYYMVSRRKILIIDNDFLLPLLCKSKLEINGGFDVDVKISMNEAIQYIARAEPDLILLSANISDVYGLDALKLLKNGPAAGVKIIILSCGKYAEEFEYFQNGAAAVIDIFENSLDSLVERVKEEISR